MIFVFIRLTSFFMATNIIFPNGTPKIFKIAFSLLLSTMIGMNLEININIESSYNLIGYTVLETITGIVLGFLANTCFYSLKIAGRLIDQQIGLSMASTYDPTTQSQATVIENILYFMGLAVFFSLNGHHTLINSIQQSFEIMPLGYSILNYNFEYILKVFIEYFIIGIQIALPVIIALIIAELIMGIISRSVQQFNVMLIGMPVKMLMGIMLIITVLPVILNQIQSLFSNLVDILDGTLVLDSDMLLPVSILLSTSDKTEEPTEKKKKDERKKGNVAKSKELINALTLCGVVLIVYVMSDSIIRELKVFLVSFLTLDFDLIMSGNVVQFVFNKAMFTYMKLFVPIGIIILILGVVGNLGQTGFLNSKEALKPQLSKLNPINGFKNMFSQTAIVNMLKSIILIIILGYIGIDFIKNNYENFFKIGYVHFPFVLYSIIDMVKQLLSIALVISIVVGAIDFAYQKYAHKKKLKMTKQEVKEEYKQMEGDPLIKSKIRQKQRQMSSQRMISNAKEANVIITNPTHISIAIRYEKGKDSAPVVVAKGADLLAKKIREIAKENDIPMIENKPLARMIYKKVDVDQEVPADMYEAVAQVLVAVYKIRNKYKKS